MSAFTDTLFRIFEDWWETIQKNGVPAASIRDQLPARTLPTTGNTGAGYTPATHDHTSSTDGGKLSAAVVDSYIVMEEIAAPSAPAANTIRFYPKDVAGITELFYKNSAGTERDLSGVAALTDTGNVTYLDFTNAAAPGTPAAGKTRIYTKTDKSYYQKDDAGAETGLAGGAGGNATSTGAVGSEPGSPASGDLYFPDNGFAVERYSGSAWVPWGPIYPLVVPPSSGWAWVNQGSSTVDTTKNVIYLSAAGAAGSVSLRIYERTAPATPYTVTLCLLPNLFANANAIVGFCWRQSSDGKVATVSSYDGVAVAQKYTDPTTFSANYYSLGVLSPPIWMKVQDDGTNRISSHSSDGQNWEIVHTVGRTDFLTGDKIGIFASSFTTSYNQGVTLLSWEET